MQLKTIFKYSVAIIKTIKLPHGVNSRKNNSKIELIEKTDFIGRTGKETKLNQIFSGQLRTFLVTG